MKASILSLALFFLTSNTYAEQSYFFKMNNSKFSEVEKILQDVDTSASCFRNSCKIWAWIDKNEQRFHLYLDGVLTFSWKTSTGRWGFETPDMDTRPNGRIYIKHTSIKYKEGDYNGLGNMPFSVFVDGEIAIHGSIRESWWRLGTSASHGCIRLHPDNAEIFNYLVRTKGIRNVWITIN